MTDKTSAAQLRCLLRDAFADGTYIEDARAIAESSLEAQQVAACFRGKRWEEVDLDLLRSYGQHADASACLTFMSAAAFRYYLPAFLLLAMEHTADIDLILDSTISNLTPLSAHSDPQLAQWSNERLTGFTSNQRQTIAAVLRFLRDTSGDDPLIEAIEVALPFWEGDAASCDERDAHRPGKRINRPG